MAKGQGKSKGGRKGGTIYPKIDLEKAIQYAKKVVSKTHTGAQPKNIILPGVFDSGSWIGEVRLSGTKQFGLIEGSPKAYLSSELAKKINSSTPNELPPLLIEACLIPKIFKTLYDTFLNDTISDAKIKQQLLNHEVHPESADECVTIFKNSLIYAGIGKILENDKFQVLPLPITTLEKDKEKSSDELKENELQEEDEQMASNANKRNGSDQYQKQTIQKRGTVKSNVNVNIDVDPSMDPEKLEKLLKLLKNYGAI